MESAFGSDVEDARLIKLYGGTTGQQGHEKMCSPAECTGIKKAPVEGSPDPGLVSTSHVEQQSPTKRIHTRRLARLTNAFSGEVSGLYAEVFTILSECIRR